MKKIFLTLLFCILVAILGGCNDDMGSSTKSMDSTKILEMVNNERAEYGVAPLITRDEYIETINQIRKENGSVPLKGDAVLDRMARDYDALLLDAEHVNQEAINKLLPEYTGNFAVFIYASDGDNTLKQVLEYMLRDREKSRILMLNNYRYIGIAYNDGLWRIVLSSEVHKCQVDDEGIVVLDGEGYKIPDPGTPPLSPEEAYLLR